MSSRRTSKRISKTNINYLDDESDFSDSEPNVKQIKIDKTEKLNTKSKEKNDENDGSSSDSSIDNYLQPSDKIDLNSSFFDVSPNKSNNELDFKSIEKNILSNVNRLSDSDESGNENENENECPQIKVTTEEKNEPNKLGSIVEQMKNYEQQLEHAKQKMANFNKNLSCNDQLDIKQLLAIGEKNEENFTMASSSDEFSDEELEEVPETTPTASTSAIPKEGIQITLEIPGAQQKKKKEDDMMTMIKRKINRVKREQQIYIHKVHLLCWIAHGNYVNSVVNNEKLLGIALSLIPSQHCYPDGRISLSYIEQITKWYNLIFKLKPSQKSLKVLLKEPPLLESLLEQIGKKEATSKKDYVLIFLCILRALGIQCRLVMSFRVVPIRPPASELCSFTKSDDKTNGKEKKTKSPSLSVKQSAEKQKPPAKKIDKKTITPLKGKLNKEQTKSTKNAERKLNDTKSSTKNKKIESLFFTEKKTEIKGKATSTQLKKKQVKDIVEVPQIDGANVCDELENDVDISENYNCSSNFEKYWPVKSSSSEMDYSDSETFTFSIPQLDGVTDASSSSNSKKNIKNRNLAKVRKVDATNLSSPEIEKAKSVCIRRSAPTKQGTKVSDEEDFKLKNQTKDRLRSKSSSDTLKVNKSCEKTRSQSTSETKSKFFRSPVKTRSKDVTKDIVNLIKGRIYEEKEKTRAKKVNKSLKESDSDSDYLPEVSSVKKKKIESDEEFDFKTKKRVQNRVKELKKVDRRILSTDEDDSEKNLNTKIGNDVWIEVFVEEEEKWISVDVIKGQVHCVRELYSRASQPMTYVVAWNNNGTIKDVTSRYCKNWHTVLRSLRVDSHWWKRTLKPYIGKKTIRDKEEDEELEKQQLEQPLPTTIAEFKNHPLYVLKRHLLKFEAIYPPDPPTLGFIHKEPVYSRDCVYTLHSRETWVKHAKVVKPGEKPYKIVKARPKYDRLTGNTISDIPLEIFGPWQVKDYEPPVAENGIVPRNAYGNVELFKPCMIPVGTVHIRLPGLNKVAKKLRIDCAPAVVGWDFHSGGSHPAFDGFVVCKEHEQVLTEAWEQEQQEAEKRAREKIEKRVYDNWRRLIKGLLIRERLKVRYGFKELDPNSKKKKLSKKCSSSSATTSKKCTKSKRKICSDSDSDDGDNK